MNRREIIDFLEVLLCRLQNDGAGSRKIDMVAEAMGIISSTEDERTVRAQLMRVNELMESLYGEGAGHPGTGAGGTYAPGAPGGPHAPGAPGGPHAPGAPGGPHAPGIPAAPAPQFTERIHRITADAHRECLVMGENFAGSAGELAGAVERDISDLAQVRASYGDLMNRRRLEKRLGMMKDRCQNRLKREKQVFIADVTSVYDNAMDKVKAMFAKPGAGSLQMTQKQLYERFDAGHDTFLVRAQSVGNDLDLAGDAFERLGNRLGKKTAGIKRKATIITVLVLLVSLAVWGILLGTAGRKAYDAAADCMEMVKDLQNPQDLLNGMGGMGGMAKMVLDNDMVQKALTKAVEAPVQAITTLIAAMKTILIILVVCVLCFYVSFVPFLIWLRKGLCIRWLERMVLAETSMFLGEMQLEQRLSQGVREMIGELEGMYSALYQELWTAPAAAPALPVTEDAAAEELIRLWRRLTVKYV